VKRFAERVAPVAQTTHPTQAGLAQVLNSLVVPPFLRRGNLAMFTGSAICAMGARYLFRETITPQMCVIHLKSLGNIRQFCRKISNFSLRFVISDAYSSKFMGDHPTINA
jgi:hypothetical protein